eukprot:125491_1
MSEGDSEMKDEVPSGKMEAIEIPAVKSGKMEVVQGKGKDNLMWIEKYRPSNLDDIISHRNVLESVKRLTDANKLPHLLFYGPPGTGKTTTALAIARKLNGEKYQLKTLELNASDARGIDVVRTQIKSFASTQQIFSSGFKLVILDEADNMTGAAQFALRRIIEQFTKTTRFCLICNYVNKIIPALQSRCTRFRFAPLESKHIKVRLRQIADNEGVNLTDDGLKAIVKLSGGDMRKCLNVLQACHVGYSVTNEINAHLCTATPLSSDTKKILDSLLNEPFQAAYQKIFDYQTENGIALVDILTHLHPLVLRVALPPAVFMYLLSQLADLEYRLSNACDPNVQLASLVGAFRIAREKTLAFV